MIENNLKTFKQQKQGSSSLSVSVNLDMDAALLKTIEGTMLPNETLSDAVTRVLKCGLEVLKVD